ncbi:MAG: glycoside hydrolase family 2 protein, partial [Marinirhabdus sp.]|nr:glycoside hydrolase family 2 protein [Marinirhabdus sp.]
LDTYADVYLNDSLILTANNAFRSWEVDVSDIIKAENTLGVVFQSVDELDQKSASQLAYELPESPRVFSRKPQFQYGWDWGPTIKTVGIWREVQLVSYNEVRLEEVYLKTKHISDSLAQLSAIISLQASENSNGIIHIKNNTTKETFRFPFEATNQNSQYAFDFQIQNPKMWWTHNLGEPFLYDFSIQLLQNGTRIDSMTKQVGIRDIQLITEKDNIGESFYFKLNGKPVYMKGANYIPQNIMLPSVTQNEREKLVNDAVEANMNMLRVWGGGVYEDDAFYELCDQKGILIWQDFMFACAMYPGDDSFLENVKREAIDNVKRLRQHPSIALWCGNNENSEGWHRWGWQADKTEAQKTAIWNDYQKVFNNLLPKVVDSLHPSVSYWESSPKYGRGDSRYQFEGDAHDWWVWHDAYPFEHFENQVPRFMSEFGFQAFPSFETIQYFTGLDDINLQHPSISTHQKHSRGFQLIAEYMARDYIVPKSDDAYVYVSQLLQARGISKGIQAHRRAKPYNMGSLYWQLNDCWPVVSWSSIDGFGNWKALHYEAKRAFKNIHVLPHLKRDTLEVWLVNDSIRPITEVLTVKLKDFNGNLVKEFSNPRVTIGTEASELKLQLPLKGIDFEKNNSFAEISFGNERTVYYFAKPKDLDLPKYQIEVIQTENAAGVAISLTTRTLQKDVFFTADVPGHFDDNYFDLLPGEQKKILFVPKKDSPSIFYINTLNRINAKDGSKVPTFHLQSKYSL